MMTYNEAVKKYKEQLDSDDTAEVVALRDEVYKDQETKQLVYALYHIGTHASADATIWMLNSFIAGVVIGCAMKSIDSDVAKALESIESATGRLEKSEPAVQDIPHAWKVNRDNAATVDPNMIFDYVLSHFQKMTEDAIPKTGKRPRRPRKPKGPEVK